MKWLKNPKVWVPIVCVLGLILVTLLMWLLTRSWLIALITSLVILLVGMVFVLVRMLIGREKEDLLDRGLEDDSQMAAADASSSRSSAEADLKARFREALSEVRRTLGGRGGVYEVPWFLVFGEGGSGKTALLGECGLDLPAQYSSSRVFGPTATVDHLLFNEAIAVDTAGRYFNSDDDAVRGEWTLLLDLLRSSRPDCPANGLIFTIDAARLLTRSPQELDEEARLLRRRLNEIQGRLGVDAPIYILVTKSDMIEGFVETANALPADRHGEAFGWTNDQRRMADPEERIAEAFEQIRARLDSFMPELLLREPDATRRRRIFGFPQEIEAAGRAAASLVGNAFKRDIYNKTPFLRGIYFVNARTEGATVSTALSRLGHDWARTQHAAGTSAPHFLRQLFLDVMIGDEELAVPDSRIGPMGRRAILGAGALVALCVLAIWGVSFGQNYWGTHDLASKAGLALSADPTIHHLKDLRDSIETEDSNIELYVNWLGFGMLERGVERAKQAYYSAFQRNFDVHTRDNMQTSLRQRDDTAFRAAVALGGDLEFLTSRGENPDDAPDLSAYMPRRVKDPEGYQVSYASFVRWMPDRDRERLVKKQRDVLASGAAGLVNLTQLERQTMGSSGRLGPVTYRAAGLAVGGEGTSDGSAVPGIYTQAGHDGLFKSLVAAVENTGAMPERKVREIERDYSDRSDRAWRRYLIDVPITPRAAEQVKESPYLKIIAQIDSNTRVELPRSGEAPAWMGILHEVRRTEPASEEEKSGPWTQYEAALENVALDVGDAVGNPEQALAIAKDVAAGKPSSFDDAIQVVRRIVPRRGDASASSKLRDILEAPVLDGFSALLQAAQRELDKKWSDRIVSGFSGQLSESRIKALYNPQGGELNGFRNEELRPFFKDGSPKQVLGNRSLRFGPRFLSWMEHATELQRSLFSGGGGGGSQTTRLVGVPSKIQGGPGLRVKRRDLRLICPSDEQVFVYREGSGSKSFNWASSCQDLSLRVTVGGQAGDEEVIRREWRGPFAFQNFLGEGRGIGGGVKEWSLDGAGGSQVLVRYRVQGGSDMRVHRSPPPSIGS